MLRGGDLAQPAEFDGSIEPNPPPGTCPPFAEKGTPAGTRRRGLPFLVHDNRIGNPGLEKPHGHLDRELASSFGQEFEIVSLTYSNGLTGGPHCRLGGGQRPAIFRDRAPLDRLGVVVE